MAEAASEYHHGQQSAAQHVATYRMFMNLAKWSALHVAVLILVLTLWFCADVSFLPGLVAGVVVLALGIWFLRAKPKPGH